MSFSFTLVRVVCGVAWAVAKSVGAYFLLMGVASVAGVPLGVAAVVAGVAVVGMTFADALGDDDEE